MTLTWGLSIVPATCSRYRYFSVTLFIPSCTFAGHRRDEIADGAAVLAADLLVPIVQWRRDDIEQQRAVQRNFPAAAHAQRRRPDRGIGEVNLPARELERTTRL